MPFKIETDTPILRISFSGRVTIIELISLARAVTKLEAEAARVPDRLMDLSGIEDRESNYEIILTIAEQRRTKKFPNQFKSAVVAPTPTAFGFARMFQTLNDNPQIDIQIFKTLEAAEAWLTSA